MKLVFALITVLLMAACTTTAGNKFLPDQANQVENGMTREEVIRVMGSKPTAVTDQGKTFTWKYTRVNRLTGTVINRNVTFTFDKEGKAFGVPEGGAYGDAAKYQ